MSLRVMVDLRNPGQFFAACGLFELAARLAPETEGYFDEHAFVTTTGPSLSDVLETVLAASFAAPADGGADGADDDDGLDRSAPLPLGDPFALRLDWWRDRFSGGRDLKVWAGTMDNTRIAAAMLAALRAPEFRDAALFDVGQVVLGADGKKVEPFYFDARRAPNAHSRDVGFSPDALGLTTTAFPAVEVLCLVGLQRFRPRQPDAARRRVFRYRAWCEPLPIELAALVVAGAVPLRGTRTFQFENWFRTSQKKHKAFRPAVPVEEGD